MSEAAILVQVAPAMELKHIYGTGRTLFLTIIMRKDGWLKMNPV